MAAEVHPESPSNKCPILNDDVLLNILSFCDISTVIAISETSRHLYTVASAREVWRVLLDELHRRNFVDLEPGKRLEDLTQSELVDLARRTVLGPPSFSFESGKDGLKLARQIILKQEVHHGPGILDWENETLLLPRSNYVLFRHLEFDCIDVARDKLIWRYTGPCNHYKVQAFTAKLVDDGRAAIIAVGIRTYEEYRQNLVEVLRLDLTTGSSTTLVLRTAPNTEHDNPFNRLRINGDFVVASLGSTNPYDIFVLRVSTGRCRSLHVPMDELDIDVLPGHLITLRSGNQPNTLTLAIFELLTLVQDDARTDTEQIMPVISETIDVARAPNPKFRISCHLSPLYVDSSRLWILISAGPRPPAEPPSTILCKYHVSHFPGYAISIRSKARWEHAGVIFPLPLGSSEISYAGWVETYYGGQHLYSLASNEPCVKNLDLPGRGDLTHLSPYSCAITYYQYDTIVMHYYE
ncbi:hypothetical protein LshimejAT787_0409490 [Lyophyllum shimeji]|uniref:F-box domain-containing protein n=1 Tax=Lyophyllum shimeji TaxID=47721 RepID=A0A9P3ULR1_LYOSH|nr:hypothetical protein LshimejAT787_0409490 [Lyophyllum shimeji]